MYSIILVSTLVVFMCVGIYYQIKNNKQATEVLKIELSNKIKGNELLDLQVEEATLKLEYIRGLMASNMDVE